MTKDKEKIRQREIRRRSSDNYKSWLMKRRILRRDEVLDGVKGSVCNVVFVRCSECGRVEVKAVKPTRLMFYYSKCSEHIGTVRNSRGVSIKGVEVKCIDCETIVMGTRATKRCSKCSSKYNKRNCATRGGSINDRARKAGVHRERISRLLVYNRDGWKCYMCGCDVVKSSVYAPNQATLDHAIPLSKGGTHTYNNLKTACHTCNSLKSDKVAAVQCVDKELVRGAYLKPLRFNDQHPMPNPTHTPSKYPVLG